MQFNVNAVNKYGARVKVNEPMPSSESVKRAE